MIEYKHTAAVLQEYADKARELYKENLSKSDRSATETLIRSVKTTVVTPTGYSIAVDMRLMDYWKYVEWDTKPHWPPSLLGWIDAKGIKPYPDSKGRLPKPEQLDFLIRRKIAKEGTTGSHDLQNTIEELNAEYEQRIADAVAEDFADATDVIIRSMFFK